MNASPSTHGRVGIIDIGSNSIRLVVYDQLKRAPVPLYNEKVMCQLGKGLASTGVLNPAGVPMAKAGIRRFIAMAKNMRAYNLHIMATAAVRDATDGAAFAQSLEAELGIPIDIISGDREAKLGAFGILASVHQPDGITGDLGGGSMEMVRLSGNTLSNHATLPIGALRLMDETKGEREKLHSIIARAFESINWLAGEKPNNFYAIGGSFRAIAHLHMSLRDYPLHILHQYTVAGEEFAGFARELAQLSLEKIEKLPTIPAKRAPTIAPAAMILSKVMEVLSPKHIVFSASGIREGYLHEMLPPEVQAQDALIASCLEMVNRNRHYSTYADELMRWMQPLLATHEAPNETRLRHAFCLLSDIAHHIHPEYRADWALTRILQSSFISLTHKERVQLSLALYHRYQYKVKEAVHPVWNAIPARERAWARLVGASANLAYHLSGGVEGTLPQTALNIEKKTVTLHLNDSVRDLMGEAILKRVSGVDEAFRKWME